MWDAHSRLYYSDPILNLNRQKGDYFLAGMFGKLYRYIFSNLKKLQYDEKYEDTAYIFSIHTLRIDQSVIYEKKELKFFGGIIHICYISTATELPIVTRQMELD